MVLRRPPGASREFPSPRAETLADSPRASCESWRSIVATPAPSRQAFPPASESNSVGRSPFFLYALQCRLNASFLTVRQILHGVCQALSCLQIELGTVHAPDGLNPFHHHSNDHREDLMGDMVAAEVA